MLTNIPVGVPKHRIPKISPVCISCGGEVTTQISQPFADGYHRRHTCKDCRTAFYTLTPYDGGSYMAQPTPFKDRPLSPADEHQRLKWWEEEINMAELVERDPFVTRIEKALMKKEEHRTPQDIFIVELVNTMKEEIASMDEAGKK